MRVTVNRKIMLEHLKSMSKLVPTSSAIPELKGFLVEANEDDGYLYVSANNIESAIQRKFTAGIEEGGAFVLDARLLMGILSKLAGDDVLFEMEQEGSVKIGSESCTYTMSTLRTENFPRPDIPFPDTTMHVAGMKQLYNKTSDTVHKNVEEILNGIHLEITPNEIRATGCDGKCIGSARHEMSCGGSMKVTLSRVALSYLVSAAGDEELEVGLCRNFVVFMKEGMLFSAKKLAREYVDTEKIFSSVGSEYEAKVEFKEFKECVRSAKNIASMGHETSYIKLDFEDEGIKVSTQNDVGGGANTAEAVMFSGTSGLSFYYPAALLENAFKTIDGTMIVRVDKRGYLLIFNKLDRYLITPLPASAVQSQILRFENQKKIARGEIEDKTVKKTRTSRKAA